MFKINSKVYIFPFILLLIIYTSCSYKEEIKQQEEETDFKDICEITKDLPSYSDKVIKLRGQIRWFHGSFIYSNKCVSEHSILFLDIPPNQFNDMVRQFEDATNHRKSSGNISGEIFLLGKIDMNEKRNYLYGQAFIEQDGNKQLKEQKIKNIKVNGITEIKILKFLPIAD